MRVPFLDLSSQSQAVKEAVLAEVAGLIDTGRFANGPAVAEFEAAFAEYCGGTHCVGMASGLDALRLGLLALGIEPGDEVIVPAQTFVATLESITQAGGVPVPVEISDVDYCLDADAFKAAIGPRTRFVMPVHLYGQVADMTAIAAVAEESGVTILEDACQAHGARRDGYRPGTRHAAAFSFYPGKNLGAFGDAGAIVLDDAEAVARLKALREHGQTAKYHHEFEGYTSRLDTIQAIALHAKLAHLDEWNAQRRDVAAQYLETLDGVGDLRLPTVPDGSEPVWHLFVIRTQDPTGLADHLAEREVGTGRHYPVPPHLSPAYAFLRRPEGSFPIAEAVARECLSLPMFPGMTSDQVASVVEAIESYF